MGSYNHPGSVAGMLTQGPSLPRDCIGFLSYALPIELAWDLMGDTYLWPPLAEREVSPQVGGRGIGDGVAGRAWPRTLKSF